MTTDIATVRIDALSKAQSALIAEPWDPNTLRAVVSAVALPIALFLMTRLLERVVF
jgi:hypothetical protein